MNESDFSFAGAQRLTASEVCPPAWRDRYRDRYRDRPTVLNALRHQRFVHIPLSPILSVIVKCSTPYGIRGLSTSCNHSSRFGGYKCSTPYGIRGCPQALNVDTRPAAFVLNALRHQRSVHKQRVNFRPTAPKVLNALRHQRFVHLGHDRGLPRAKTVLNALRHQRFVHECDRQPQHCWYGAQRLTASEVCPPEPLMLISSPAACSTPYGIRGLSTWNR